MSIFELLQNNKGTVSSALGKELALEVLNGKHEILKEAVTLTYFQPNEIKAKTIRSGAAKIVEKVAEKKPDLVAPYLEKLLQPLKMSEPQTRWMLIRAIGLCAEYNTDTAIKGIEYAESFIKEKKGVCLSGAAEVYLGYVGALSREIALQVLPILEEALENAVVNEVDWILEGFISIMKNLNESEKNRIVELSEFYQDASKKSTQKRVAKILKIAKSL